MSIRIVNPDKQKVIEKDGSKFFYTFPARTAVYDCYYKVLGNDFDLSRLNEKSLRQDQLSDILSEICKQSVSGWENVIDEDGVAIDFDIELVAYMPFDLKVEVFNEVMGFLAKMLGTESILKAQHTKKSSTKSVKSQKATKKH